jgi:hypothetical protein
MKRLLPQGTVAARVLGCSVHAETRYTPPEDKQKRVKLMGYWDKGSTDLFRHQIHERCSRSAHASRPTDAVNEGVGVLRRIELDHHVNVRNVQPSSSYVRAQQHA